MILESVRMVADWLNAGAASVGSVNALIPGVPRDAGDPQPGNITVYDATRHGWVARLMAGYEGSGITFPAVAVFIATDITADGETLTNYRDGMVDVCAMYVTQKNDSAAGEAAALYTQRAILRSLRQFSAAVNYDTYRVRNGVALRSCETLKAIHPSVVKGGIVLTAGVVATYHVRDEAP